MFPHLAGGKISFLPGNPHCLERLKGGGIPRHQALCLQLRGDVQENPQAVMFPQQGMAAVRPLDDGGNGGAEGLRGQEIICMAVVGTVQCLCAAFQRKQYFRKQPLKVHVSAGLCHSLRCPLGKGKIEVIHMDNIAASLSL